MSLFSRADRFSRTRKEGKRKPQIVGNKLGARSLNRSAQQPQLSGFDIGRIDRALERLKNDVASAHEECRTKQEKLDQIAHLTGPTHDDSRSISTR